MTTGDIIDHKLGVRATAFGFEPLNWRELVSVKTMTSYVAHNQNVPEQKICDFVAAAFAVSDINGLRRDQFERVIAFLVDLNSELLVH